jgi:hypothetical protein
MEKGTVKMCLHSSKNINIKQVIQKGVSSSKGRNQKKEVWLPESCLYILFPLFKISTQPF